jgi:uncharacterized RDD family membrane protein YckC
MSMETGDNPYQAPGSESELARGEKHYGLASPGQRLLNLVLDRVFIAAGSAALMFLLSFAAPDSLQGIAENGLQNFGFSVGVTLLYYTLLESLTGRTLAKIVTETKVVGAGGGTPSFFSIVVRTLARFIPFEQFSFTTADKPGWHDTLSNTRVVRLKPSKMQRLMEEA